MKAATKTTQKPNIMNPQIKQKLEELVDLISKHPIEGGQDNRGTTIEGWQDNEGATIEGWQDNVGATIKGWQDNRGATIEGGQDNAGAIIEGLQYNEGAIIEGKMIFNSETIFKKGIWKRINGELTEYVLTPKK